MAVMFHCELFVAVAQGPSRLSEAVVAPRASWPELPASLYELAGPGISIAELTPWFPRPHLYKSSGQ